jgi:acyl dehydratase
VPIRKIAKMRPTDPQWLSGIEDKGYSFGRYLEDFSVGDVYRHWPGKTITEGDNHLFSLLTMNHHPVHLDHNYAASAEHGRPLVVGTLVFSLSVGLSVRDVSGRAIANLGYREIRHLGPVFCGDTIYAITEVLATRGSSSKPDRGIVTVRTHVVNQDDQPVLTFDRDVLIPRMTP